MVELSPEQAMRFAATQSTDLCFVWNSTAQAKILCAAYEEIFEGCSLSFMDALFFVKRRYGNGKIFTPPFKELPRSRDENA